MTADLENTLYLDVPAGRVVIELLPELAPNHVARIKELAREGFYDGLAFHRVIDGFMVQTDRQYSVWGRAVSGMEHIDAIKKGAPGSGTVSNPDHIVKMQVAADAEGAES